MNSETYSDKPLGFYKKVDSEEACESCGRTGIKPAAGYTKARGLYLVRKKGKEMFVCHSCAKNKYCVI